MLLRNQFIQRLSMSFCTAFFSSSDPRYFHSILCSRRTPRYLTLHLSMSWIWTCSASASAALIAVGESTQGSLPDMSLIALKLAPVLDLTSLDIRLARLATSKDWLSLRLLKTYNTLPGFQSWHWSCHMLGLVGQGRFL